MASPAMEQAVAMPEILECVFNFIETDYLALWAALQVNKLWFDCATDSLWKRASVVDLADVAKDRQQIYAAKIESAKISRSEEDLHRAFNDLSFDKLVDVEIGSKGGRKCLSNSISGQDSNLRFNCGLLTGDTLSHIQATCWRLKDISISCPGSQITPEMMVDFISGCESLESVSLGFETSNLTSNQLLHHLASRPNLTKLSFDRSLEPALISEIAEATSGQPFPALRSLSITEPLPSASGVLLAGLLPQITIIDLRFKDSENDVLGSTASIRDLHHMNFLFYNEPTFSAGQLLSLKSHRNLESLNLRPDGGKMYAPDFTDADFRQLTSQLPNLRNLWFEVECDLTTASLAFLSNQCRTIEQIDLPQQFNWDALLSLADPSSALFPNLTKLILGGMISNDRT
uniref:F-box domain-containing protein n=1 Tax=Bionectria ochroleuca TaxID=29856 RepID=A0A8H7K6E8_BIOOC